MCATPGKYQTLGEFAADEGPFLRETWIPGVRDAINLAFGHSCLTYHLWSYIGPWSRVSIVKRRLSSRVLLVRDGADKELVVSSLIASWPYRVDASDKWSECSFSPNHLYGASVLVPLATPIERGVGRGSLWLACPRGLGLGLPKSTLLFPRWGLTKTTGISKRKRNAMIRKTRVKYEHKWY